MVKLGSILNKNFEVSFGKLTSAEGLSGSTLIRIKRKLKKISEEAALAEEVRKKLCEEVARKGENGEPIMVDGNFDIPDEDRPRLVERVGELYSAEIDLGPKIPFEAVAKAGLSVHDLLVLEPVLDDPIEEVE